MERYVRHHAIITIYFWRALIDYDGRPLRILAHRAYYDRPMSIDDFRCYYLMPLLDDAGFWHDDCAL